MVLFASGAAIPISQLKPGDKVLATNTNTGRTSAEPVALVLLHHDTDRYDLKIRAGRRAAVIDTTRRHLFWDLTRHRWVQADRLHLGDRLRGPKGRAAATVISGHASRNHDGWMWDPSVPGGPKPWHFWSEIADGGSSGRVLDGGFKWRHQRNAACALTPESRRRQLGW